MQKLITILALTILALTLPNETAKSFASQAVLGEQTAILALAAPQPLHTASRFESKLVTSTRKIARKTIYQDNPDLELDQEQVIDEGKDGSETTVLKVTYFEGTEYQREVVSKTFEPPEDRRVMRGTKIVWRSLATADGEIRYWRKLRVWATHYDSRCPGCNEWTATGLRQGKGVIAVDPDLIKLGSRVYVIGYGPAIAGDTGGAIKGKIIDLGFEDARTAGWKARFVDIYLL